MRRRQHDDDGCTSACATARCGDGITRTDLAEGEPGFEVCDDGNEDNDDECTTVCAPRCGDGLLSGDEACDDGNTRRRRLHEPLRGGARGDGIVWAGEETCDDQNGTDDACTNACQVARCGDGITRADVAAGAAGRAAMMATSSWVTGAETTAPSSAAAMGSTTRKSNVTTETQSRPCMHRHLSSRSVR